MIRSISVCRKDVIASMDKFRRLSSPTHALKRGDILSIQYDNRGFIKDRFYTAEGYIQASKNLIDGMLNTGNPYVISSDHELSSDELTEGLRNSSQSIILPTLFCLYQGIELLLKGFVNAKCDCKSGHDADLLNKKFSDLYTEEIELITLFDKFISQTSQFEKSNQP